LAGLGLVTSDSFAGLRALITPSSKRKPLASARRRHRTVPFGIESAGRWSLFGKERGRDGVAVEAQARTLLRRYGVVFKRLLAREPNPPAWRDLLLVYRRLEARGEIRGGRFVAGMSGEQFALPEAVGQLRAIRRTERAGKLISVAAADPLNLTGLVTPGERIAAQGGNRILYRDGSPVAALDGGMIRSLDPSTEQLSSEEAQALVRKPMTPALRARLGLAGVASTAARLNRPPRRKRAPSP
jgi:ATP-dependent Lhr-like helicase